MLALAGILTYGGFRVQAGFLSLGVVAAFLQYGLRFFRPIQDLSEKYNILQSAMASSERIFKLLDTSPAAVAPEFHRPGAGDDFTHRVRPCVAPAHCGGGLGYAMQFHHLPGEPSPWWAIPARAFTLISLLLRHACSRAAYG